jgi:integrase
MTADMVELLSGFQKDLPNDVFILTGRKDKPFEPRSLQSSFHAFLKKHGLPDHTFHSLRHTFATRVIEKGYDPKTVSEILGHKNVKTTLDLYVHPSMTHKREIVEAASLFPEK